MILAGDVGGTKVVLALVEAGDGRLTIRREARYETAEYSGLQPIVREFLAASDARPDLACFGVAGPISGARVEMTNLDWSFDSRGIAEDIGVRRAWFLNDLAAAALGIEAVDEERIVTLQEGEPRGATSALIAAGTGLGMAILTEVEGRPHVLPSEGGHQTFAPRSGIEVELRSFLSRRFPGHVSAERVVSGAGIEAIYEFLRETGREDEPDWLVRRLAESEDRSEAISAIALAGEARICQAALDVFAGCYASAAGDLALAALALRGVYLGGGIAPAILPVLESEPFLESFRAKGRLRELLERVPLKVIAEPLTPVLGAARYAVIRAGGPSAPGGKGAAS